MRLSIFNILLIFTFLFTGCSVTKIVPVETKIAYNYIDSVNVIDSTVLIEKSIYRDYTLLPDTLVMYNSTAVSKSWVDTTLNILKGSLESTGDIKFKYLYKDRYISKTDSIYIEKPIEVEVVQYKLPKWAWYSLAFNVIFIIGILIKIYLKIRGI